MKLKQTLRGRFGHGAFTVLLAMVLTLCLTAGKKQTTIFVIGDSTAAEKKNAATNPERGWGMVLQGFFDKDVIVNNHAVNGRSSLSFINEGRWQTVLEKIKPGDYVLIQFGHNDEKPDPKRHTVAGGSFDELLARYVKETREKGGIPVLLSPVARRNFYNIVDSTQEDEALRKTTFQDEKINSDTLIDTHGAYRLVARRVAQQEGCLYIDANRLTSDLEQQMGPLGSRKLHMWFAPGEVKSIPKGRHDNTHYNVYGARLVAGLIADALGQAASALGKHVEHYDYVVSEQGRGNYMSLDEAVKDAANRCCGGKPCIYVVDGQWTISKAALKKVRLVVNPAATVQKTK